MCYDVPMNKITLDSKSYPTRLSERLGDKAPSKLYCMGNMGILDMAGIGFCGSREASKKAIQTAEDCTSEIVSHNMVAVSGYARGVDEAVHLAALRNGGYTLIVLPEGIETFKVKSSLKEVWDWKRVLVVSEFEPKAGWQVFRAMQRNLTIIGLSEAMIVVEARNKGGTIQAGRQTLNLKRPLFTISYKDNPKEASGNLELQKKGAQSLGKNPETNRPNMAKVFHTIANWAGLTRPMYQHSLF